MYYLGVCNHSERLSVINSASIPRKMSLDLETNEQI